MVVQAIDLTKEWEGPMIRFLKVLFVVFLFSPASGQTVDSNALTNGSFDFDISGWNAGTDATIVWDSMDAGEDPGSGSGLLTNTATFSGARGVSQCVSKLEPGREYLLRAMVFIPSGQSETGNGYPSIWLYDQPDCPLKPSSCSAISEIRVPYALASPMSSLL